MDDSQSGRPLSAIVLAAGHGTRMRSDRPKPLHVLVGKPMVVWVLDALADCSVGRVSVVVGHGADEVTKRLVEEAGDRPLEFVEQTVQRGTGDDLDSSGKSSSSSNYSYDNFGYRHAKRLMKSRTNKKIAGVCGGLAKYFGLSSTVVRFIFGAVFIMGWGTSLLIYIGLALAMPKEPIEMMDDFDF